MTIPEVDWLKQFLATDVTLLPEPTIQRAWLCLGWSVVMAWVGAQLASRLTSRKPERVAVVLACAGWIWLPGPYSLAYWLGLAFQMPSITTVFLCAGLLGRLLVGGDTPTLGVADAHRNRFAAMGAALGTCLMLDTFSLFPAPLYPWGFSIAALVVVMSVGLLPWVLGSTCRPIGGHWLLPTSVLLFMALRLPTGNIWDAVMDPWLCVGLIVTLLRQRLRRN